MTTTYNQIAGQSVERLAALSDGIFAVAMTLLVLDLHVPAVESIHTEHDLWRALVLLSPQLVMYLMTFMTLGIFWLGQQTQLNHLVGSHRSLAWLHIGFLFAVSIMPFLTRLLAEYPTYRLALIAYWLNIVVLGGMLYLSWVCAPGSGARQTRVIVRGVNGDQAPHRHGTGSLYGCRAPLRGQHDGEYRRHRAHPDLVRVQVGFQPPGDESPARDTATIVVRYHYVEYQLTANNWFAAYARGMREHVPDRPGSEPPGLH
jgi:uncharacterized membrane protein